MIGIDVKNIGTGNMDVAWADNTGAIQTNPTGTFFPGVSMSGQPAHYTITWPQSNGFAFRQNSTLTNIAPNATAWLVAQAQATSVGSPFTDVPGVTMTFNFKFYAKPSSGSTWTLYNKTFTKVIDFARTAGAGSHAPNGNWRPQLYSVTGTPPLGKITATGGTVGLNGRGKISIEISSNGVSWLETSYSNVTAGTPGAAIADVVYTTNTPAADDGKFYRVVFNGVVLKEDEIVNDPELGYTIVWDVSAQQMEGLVPEITTNGDGLTELPVNGPDGTNTHTPDPSHVRPDAPSVNSLGPDPVGDTNANTTVKDQYRATRAAIEDALQGSPGSFNFAEWEKTGEESESAEGEGVGNMLSGGLGALTGVSGGNYGYAAPGGGTAAITLHNGSGSVIGTITPPAMASSVRAFLLVFVSIMFLLCMVTIIRSGFAGR